MDWLGSFLLSCVVGLFAIAMTIAPEKGWSSPYFVLPLAGMVAAFYSFGAWATRAKWPLIPRSVWRDSSLLLVSFHPSEHHGHLCAQQTSANLDVQTLFSTLCLSMAFFACLFWLSFFMQDMQNLTPLEVGIRLLPQAVTGLMLSPVIGCWMHKVNNTLILAAAAALQAVASILLLFLKDDSNYFALIFPSLVLSTLSMDWVRNVGAVSFVVICIIPASDVKTTTYRHAFSNTLCTLFRSMIRSRV